MLCVCMCMCIMMCRNWVMFVGSCLWVSICHSCLNSSSVYLFIISFYMSCVLTVCIILICPSLFLSSLSHFYFFFLFHLQLWTFGYGRYGQLGHGSNDDCSIPRTVLDLCGSRVGQVACGRGHTLVYIPSQVQRGESLWREGGKWGWREIIKGRRERWGWDSLYIQGGRREREMNLRGREGWG